MADIFVSYARPNREQIERLASALEASGYSLWWDRQMGGGAEFARIIETELNSAGAVIVAWSAQSLDSHWVRDEADFARGQGKLLPLSLDGAVPPLGFRQIHCIDFSTWDGDIKHRAYLELLESLRETKVSQSAAVAAGSASAAQARTASKPGIAVLPFANMSSDEEVEFLADGLTEDIITLLSSNRHLSVPARTSVFAFKNKNSDIRAVGEELNSRYVVEGSIRKLGQKARVTVQLIAAESGEHLWAKKFDLALEQLIESSDDIVEKIAGGLFAQLTWAESDRSEHAAVDSLGPWELCMRAATRIGRAAGSMNRLHETVQELDKAVSMAPDYGLAHALRAWACNAALINGMYETHEASDLIQSAKLHMRRARELAQEDLLTLTYIGAAENYAGMQERSINTLEQVLRRNPASAEAYYLICQSYAYLGRFDDARNAIRRAKELAPEAGFAPLHDWYHGLIEYLAGDYSTALPLLQRKALDNPEYGYVNVVAALCEWNSDNQDSALKYIAKARQYNPQLDPRKLQPMMLAQFDSEKGKRELMTLESLWHY